MGGASLKRCLLAVQTRTVFEFKPARAYCYRILSPGIADLQEPRLEVEFLLINWPRPAIPEGIQAAFQLYKRANVFPVMNIETQHVSLVEIAVPERRLSPVVVPNLLPYFSGLSADRHEPVIAAGSKPDVFERVPEILTV